MIFSDRQSEIAIMRDNAHLGPSDCVPQGHMVRHSIAQRAAVGILAALERSWNANEFHIHRIGVGSNDGVPMPAHVDKGQVRGKIRI